MIVVNAFITINEPGSNNWVLSNIWDKFDDKLYAEIIRQKQLKRKREFIIEQENNINTKIKLC